MVPITANLTDNCRELGVHIGHLCLSLNDVLCEECPKKDTIDTQLPGNVVVFFFGKHGVCYFFLFTF